MVGSATDASPTLGAAPTVADRRRTHPADPDFDAASARPGGFDPLPFHRLVVNPFLAALMAAALAEACRHGGARSFAIPGFILLPLLIQYHCLDCGRTGVFLRRGRHACPAVVARWREDRPARWPMLGARPQFVFWLYALGIVATILAVVAWAPV